jgi:hypothetical protein
MNAASVLCFRALVLSTVWLCPGNARRLATFAPLDPRFRSLDREVPQKTRELH